MTFMSRSEMRKPYANINWERSDSEFTRVLGIVTYNPS
jgi:hypothetical protein